MGSKCNCTWGGCEWSKTMKVLLVVGGLNWGLIGLGMLMGETSSWNLVHVAFGSMPMFEAAVYVLVGVAALMKISGCRCKKCMATCASCASCPAGVSGDKV